MGNMKNVSVLKYLICLFSMIILCFIGHKFIVFLEQNGSYITTKGLSDIMVRSDAARMTISIENESDLLQSIKTKRQSDQSIVKEFLLARGITSDEITGAASDIVDQNKYRSVKEIKKLNYKITDYIHVNSKNVDFVKKALDDLSQLLDQNIFATGYAQYFCTGLNKLRLDMIKDAANDAKERALMIIKISPNKTIELKNFTTGLFSISSEHSLASEGDSDRYGGGAESSIVKRIRVVVNARFNIK